VKRRRKQGVYILPSLLTTISLFAGFYGIIEAINGHPEKTIIAILIAAFMDGLDGCIARLTNTVTVFGAEYDSLSDLVTFGIAPAILAFTYTLKPLGRLGFLAAFLYVACGALRLARFNTQAKKINLNYFIGLPIPAAAISIILTINICRQWQFSAGVTQFVILGLSYLLSFLMVSNIHYHSFKDLQWVKHRPFQNLVLFVLLMVVIMVHPFFMLWAISIAYLISGPASIFFHKRVQVQAEAKGKT